MVNLIDMPCKINHQITPTRMHFDEENESPAQNAQRVPDKTTFDTTRTPESTPNTSAEIYMDSFNFALSRIFMRKLLAGLTAKGFILEEVRDCALTNKEERCNVITSTLSGAICTSNRAAFASTTRLRYLMS